MKETLSIAMFALSVPCFVAFVTTVRPSAFSAMQAASRLLPKTFFRCAGMRLACLRSSVRRRQATAATWRRRV